MFLRLFLTLLLMAGLTVDFNTMSLSFGTSVYAYDDDDDEYDCDCDGDDGSDDGGNEEGNEDEEGEEDEYEGDNEDGDFDYGEEGEDGEDGEDGEEEKDIYEMLAELAQENGIEYNEWDDSGEFWSNADETVVSEVLESMHELNDDGSSDSSSDDHSSDAQNSDSGDTDKDDKAPDGWGYHGSIDGGMSVDEFVVTAHQEEEKEPEEKDEPVTNDDDDEEEGDDEERQLKDPNEPKEEDDECQGEQCDICGGYRSAGTVFRSSGGSASNCPACTCSECKKVSNSAEKHVNHQNYKTLLNDMTADDMAGKVGVMLDWGAQNPNNVGEMQWTGRTYDNLSSAQSTIAAEMEKNPEYGNPTIVGAVYQMEEGQTTFTDRQLVDLLEMHAHGISFSGIYLVGGGSVYSLRINSSMGANSVTTSDIKGLRAALDGDNFSAENSTEGKIYQNAMKSSGNELYSKISMYNEMNFGISFLKGKLAGEDYSFSKIEASMSSESGLNEINGEKCE